MRTRYRILCSTILTATLAACSPHSNDQSPDPGAQPVGETGKPQDCSPLETRSPNATNQQPAFTGQTRACATKSSVAFDVAVVATGLATPWAVEPLPGGDFLVTEKSGNLRIVSATGTIGAPITGLPAVDARGQGGLLDVALSNSFATDRTIFWSFSEPRQGGNGTSVARGVLSADRRSVGDVRVIFRAMPTYDNGMHFGSRVTVAPDGKLFITTGDRASTNMRPHAQRLNSHLGKVMRINADGSVPSDNPFVGQANAFPEIWSIGHRNTQAAAFDADGDFWIIEHGTRGGDELNEIEKGENYGWPIQAYGVEYSGSPIASAATTRPDVEQPAYYWDPVIAPSGAQFYTGNAFPEWRGSLFVGSLKEQRLVRLARDGDRVNGEEHLLTDRGQRIRDVRQGLDGNLYLVTDAANGQLLRIAPRR